MFRSLLVRTLRANGKGPDIAKIQAIYNESTYDVNAFVDHVLPLIDVVLHKWFLLAFPEPSRWQLARQRFAASAALMSMTGYVIGLGDRHAENVLIDVVSGHCVHVDFACLFLRGLTLKIPEVVPFRLTRNMVDGMGLEGYSGTFQSSCERSLALLRDHKGIIMNTLDTFVHDPLIEWLEKTGDDKERVLDSREATKQMRLVKERLEGYYSPLQSGERSKTRVPLSVTGHVQELLEEATSNDRLSRMYIGWGAYY
jgi:serine/threonine-protein kinase ATR